MGCVCNVWKNGHDTDMNKFFTQTAAGRFVGEKFERFRISSEVNNHSPYDHDYLLAERERFELSVALVHHTAFRERHLNPLGHLSVTTTF